MGETNCKLSMFLNKANMTQRELAKAIGTTEVSVSRYVTGERIPKATTCIQMAKVLGCTVEDLYELNGTEEYRKAECKNDVAVFNKCMEIMQEFDTWEIMDIISVLSHNISQYRDKFPLKLEEGTEAIERRI